MPSTSYIRSMERMKSLDPPHKGLRNALGQFGLLAGKTNYQDLEEIQILKKLGSEVFHILKDHTHTENEFILKPLEEKAPGSTQIYLEDHGEIENWEKELEETLMAFDGQQDNDEGHAFYLDFCNFQSVYLEHIDEEDIGLEEAMQANFSDEELMAHQITIMQQMPFETLLLWFKYIVPARRAEENAQVLTGFKSAAPSEAYQQVIELIQSVISKKEWEKIESMIAQ